MTVIDEIAAERNRQVLEEGWDAEHDASHESGALAAAAACYAHVAEFQLRPKNKGKPPPSLDSHFIYQLWPFDEEWWKPKNPRRDLVRAAALIVAEIERIDGTDSAHTRSAE